MDGARGGGDCEGREAEVCELGVACMEGGEVDVVLKVKD